MFIYALVDPRDGRARYIGQSDNPERRLKQHIDTALKSNERGPLLSWIRQLHHRHKAKPRLDIIDVCSRDEVNAVEQWWIRETSATEPQLLNKTGNPQYVRLGSSFSSPRVRRSSLTPGTYSYTVAEGILAAKDKRTKGGGL